MIQTLYKTATPEKGNSERYILVLTTRPGSGRKFYHFMEEHGFRDMNANCFVCEVCSISTDSDLTYEEGIAMFNQAKERLAVKGFVHSFVPGSDRKLPRVCQSMEAAAVTA